MHLLLMLCLADCKQVIRLPGESVLPKAFCTLQVSGHSFLVLSRDRGALLSRHKMTELLLVTPITCWAVHARPRCDPAQLF